MIRDDCVSHLFNGTLLHYLLLLIQTCDLIIVFISFLTSFSFSWCRPQSLKIIIACQELDSTVPISLMVNNLGKIKVCGRPSPLTGLSEGRMVYGWRWCIKASTDSADTTSLGSLFHSLMVRGRNDSARHCVRVWIWTNWISLSLRSRFGARMSLSLMIGHSTRRW